MSSGLVHLWNTLFSIMIFTSILGNTAVLYIVISKSSVNTNGALHSCLIWMDHLMSDEPICVAMHRSTNCIFEPTSCLLYFLSLQMLRFDLQHDVSVCSYVENWQQNFLLLRESSFWKKSLWKFTQSFVKLQIFWIWNWPLLNAESWNNAEKKIRRLGVPLPSK